MPQKQGVLEVRTHPRWSQGTLAYFQNSPPLMVLLKTNTIFIPWYLANIGQVPARFHEKHNNLSISENGMFFILWDFTLSNCTSKYTKKNLGSFYSTQNSLTTNFYYMFSLKLCRGKPAHMLVPSPFWVRPISDHIKLKKCLIWTQRPWPTFCEGYL